MLSDQQLLIHKEFRKYLRIKEGHKGNMLNTLINATEKSLLRSPSAIIRL